MSTASKYQETWELDSLMPHPERPEFREILDRFRTNLTALADQSDRLPPINGEPENVAAWSGFLREFESIWAEMADLHSFVGCHAAADAANKPIQRLEAELSSLGPLHNRISTNIEFALKQASQADVDAAAGGDEWLSEIRFFLDDSRRHAELRLPKELELLAADLSVDGLHAWSRLYDRLSGALRIQVMEKGELVEKSPGQVTLDVPERSVRENNFYAAAKSWATIADSCADALNHISGTRLTVYRRLGVPDHLEAPLRLNRMQRETLDAMWSAISQRKSFLLKYLDCKARLLGLDKLTWYDLAAPLPRTGTGTRPTLTYDDACDLVIDAFGRFSAELGDFARMAIQNRWVEAENRTGKQQGGFCTGFSTKQQSRIFMTFANSPDGMSTLAHELGHAYHSDVLRDRPVFLQEYPMNLAETASTFAEAVLGEERLRSTDSTAEQLDILDIMLTDTVAFLMNIHTRFLFEDNFHKERSGGEIPAERFSELMLAAQKEAYLDGLADDGWYPDFWISKLHFYIGGYPFYNFPYTFGYLLSLGVYAVGAEAGDEFPEQYRRLLIATGCQTTEDAVQSTMGYDLRDGAFWNKSLDIVEQRVERFLELAGGRNATSTRAY